MPAFTRQRGIFTQIDPQGAANSVAFGVNVLDYCGSFTPASGNGHGLFDQNGTFSQFDFPGAASIDGNAINPPGAIVGDFFDHAGVEHGYIARH